MEEKKTERKRERQRERESEGGGGRDSRDYLTDSTKGDVKT